jgi:hypothetical protein
MNQHTIISQINEMPTTTPEERKLMTEGQFIQALSKVVYKICKNNVEMSSNQLSILLNSLLRRYRRMVYLQAREIQSNGKLFLQLLKQKMKDNFKTLDRNLNKFQVRNDLRQKTSKINQMSVKNDLKKCLSHWSGMITKLILFQGH